MSDFPTRVPANSTASNSQPRPRDPHCSSPSRIPPLTRQLASAPRERIQTILAEAGKPLSRRQNRKATKERAETVRAVLQKRTDTGNAVHTRYGYQHRTEQFPTARLGE